MKVKGILLFSGNVQEGLKQEMDAKLRLSKEESKAQVAFERAVMKAGQEYEEFRKRTLKNVNDSLEGEELTPERINQINKELDEKMQAYLEDEIELPDYSFGYDNIKDHEQFTGRGKSALNLIGVYRE